jgi:competence/damage-inducible protein CinA C-terminal domain
MTAEIVTVGTEIVLGNIVNTHARFLSEKMADLGVNVYCHVSVGDNKGRIIDAVSAAVNRSDIVFVCGGLGPTTDDITSESVVCALRDFGVGNIELLLHQPTLDRIKKAFTDRGIPMTQNNINQAILPCKTHDSDGGCRIKDVKVVDNHAGFAPGVIINLQFPKKSVIIILLPGPPSELVPMTERDIIPFLSDYTDTKLISKTVKIFGIGESRVAEILGERTESNNPTVALYAKEFEVHCRVSSKDAAKVDGMTEEISRLLGGTVYGINSPDLPTVLVEKLKQQNKKVAIAESITGGKIADLIVSVPGASDVFEFGLVTYSNAAKAALLGVLPKTIEQNDVVSAAVAEEMAVGIQKKARTISAADIGIGITGYAHTGLVYIAVATDTGVKCYELKLSRNLENERERIRLRAAYNALWLIYKTLDLG